MIPPSFILALFMLLSGTVAAILAAVAWRNRAIPIIRPFILLMAAEAIWIFGNAFELLSPDLSSVLLFNNIEYPAIMTVPVAWLFLVLCYTGRGRYLTRRTVPLFFIIPVIVVLLVLTNPWHHLYYTGFHALDVGGSVIWIYEHGPLFWIAIAYCYILGLVSLLLAVGRLLVATELYRRQMALLVLAACIPTAINMAYIFRLAPFPEYDLTPIAFLVASLLFAIGFLRFQLFSVVPVAYSQVFSTMQDGVVATDPGYRVIDLNPAACRILRVSPDRVIGRPVTELLPVLSGIAGGESPGKAGRHAEISLDAGGSLRFFDVLVSEMGSGPGVSGGCLFLFRDITERKQAELALFQANRKISLLASITRHDLQNKLMGAASYLELSRELATDPLQKEYLFQQERTLSAMGEQIAFTKEYEQLGTEAPAWQDAAAAIARARDHVDPGRIVMSVEDVSWEIYADPMLWKVFYNLFDNAVRYGGEGISEIRVTSSSAEGALVIAVSDNGAGIPESDKARLFTRGFGKNTGLGLFLSREILAITGITISETGVPGRGARFEIRVPAGKYRPAG